MKNKFKLIQTLLIGAIMMISPLFLLSKDNTTLAQTDETLNVYLFYGNGCPHCAKEREFLNSIKDDYQDDLKIYEYEIYYDEKNIEIFNLVITHLDINVGGVPFLVVGEKYFVGYGGDETTGKEIQKEIDRCLSEGCVDNLKTLLLGESSDSSNNSDTSETADDSDISNNSDISETTNSSDDTGQNSNNSDSIKISQGSNGTDSSPVYLETYIFGKINLKNLSLPIATILIAFVDGFNPCAMWILIFLITMLINMKDKKRLYILGSTFIITSGLVYFVFLSAWFNFFKLIGFVYWIKVIIGIIAIVSGFLHIKNALSSKGGCHATNEKQRESIMTKIKKIVGEKSFGIALVGIITLAISVNLVEVVCSAGLPAIYTNLLSTIELSTFSYYLYLILYVIIFMLDDLLIFFIAIKTFEVTGIQQKYAKWSNLVGGIIILIIGIILILKPELLMFG